MEDDIFGNECFDAAIALTLCKKFELNHLPHHFSEFLDVDGTGAEWRNFSVAFSEEEKQSLTSMEIGEMWPFIVETKNFENINPFYNKATLATFALSSSHSNAQTERIFSIVSDGKPKKRNRSYCLKSDPVVRSSFQAKCVDFTTSIRAPPGHLALHISSNSFAEGETHESSSSTSTKEA